MALTGSLGGYVGSKLHDDAAGLLPTNLDVKVHLKTVQVRQGERTEVGLSIFAVHLTAFLFSSLQSKPYLGVRGHGQAAGEHHTAAGSMGWGTSDGGSYALESQDGSTGQHEGRGAVKDHEASDEKKGGGGRMFHSCPVDMN